MIKNTISVSIIALFTIMASTVAYGQADSLIYELSSPYQTLNTYFQNLKVRNYHPEKAAIIVSPSIKDSTEREEIALKFKEILTKKNLRPNMSEVPTAKDYRDTITDQCVFTPFAKVLPDIYLERVGTNWYLSEESSELIPTLYSDLFPIGVEFIEDYMPLTGQKTFLGIKIWQYAAFALLLVLGHFLMLALSMLIKILIRWLIKEERVAGYPLHSESRRIAKNLSLTTVFWLFLQFIPSLHFPVYWSDFLIKGCEIAIVIFIAATLVRLLEFLAYVLSKKALATETKMDDQAIPIVKSILKGIIVIFASLYTLKLMEVNVTALIAGISIGGLALALAAQETVKNFIGSMIVFIDKPFQIGDFVEIEGKTGMIIEVGIRSTKLRAKDNSIISIPNGRLLSALITNMGIHGVRMMETKLDLKPDTTSEDIEKLIEGLKDIVRTHPKALIRESKINLHDVQASAITVRFRTYLKTKGHDEELAVKEDIYLKIINLIRELEIKMK